MLGRIMGYWQNSISTYEYAFHIKHLDMPFYQHIYQHNRGQITTYDKEAWLRMMNEVKKTGEM